MTSLVLPSTIKSIGSGGFGMCMGLIKVAYPNTVSISVSSKCGVISYDPNNVLFENGFIYDAKKTAILYAPMTLQGAFTLPSTVTTIGSNAFLAAQTYRLSHSRQDSQQSITAPSKIAHL